MDLSDGEVDDDDDGEADLDTSSCKTCNLTFPNSKVCNICQTQRSLLASCCL